MEESGGGRGSRRSVVKDWTTGNIFHNLLSLSWPIVVGNSLNLLGPVIDMVWVAKLGAASIAGVGVAGMAVMLVTSARMGLSQGTRALVARFVGAGDSEGANHIGQQAFVISGTYTIIVASIGIFFAEPIMGIFGLEAEVIAEGAAYMRIMFISTVAMSFRMMAEAIMQASGDTVTPMRITVVFRIFHAGLSPLLIFGLWIFPRMGVSGAAAANAISQGLGGMVALWILFSGHSRLRLSLKNFSLDFGAIWRILKIGIPASITAMERTFGDLALMWFMAPFGTIAVAGHTLIQRMQAILRMPNMGLGIGSGVLAGQNLGANQPDRAEKGGWLAVGVGEAFTILVSIAILFWAESFVRVFSSDPEIVSMTSSFLRVGVGGYALMGIYYILQNTIAGAGDTMPPMLVTLLNFWLVQIPLAFILPKYTDLGVLGVRWAIVAGMVVGVIAYVTYFRMGRWKQKRV
ncbi:MAG: MATE family efflux transporter [Dehalococcoidales bacterium]